MANKHERSKRRRLKKDQPDPEWTYTPPPLSEEAERFLAFMVEQHPPTQGQGLTIFLHIPILRQILFWLEQGGPAPRPRGDDEVTYIEGLDLLMFGAGTRAERERVWISLVETIALLAFAIGGIPCLPHVCEAHDAQVIAHAFAAFQEANRQKHNK